MKAAYTKTRIYEINKLLIVFLLVIIISENQIESAALNIKSIYSNINISKHLNNMNNNKIKTNNELIKKQNKSEENDNISNNSKDNLKNFYKNSKAKKMIERVDTNSNTNTINQTNNIANIHQTAVTSASFLSTLKHIIIDKRFNSSAIITNDIIKNECLKNNCNFCCLKTLGICGNKYQCDKINNFLYYNDIYLAIFISFISILFIVKICYSVGYPPNDHSDKIDDKTLDIYYNLFIHNEKNRSKFKL